MTDAELQDFAHRPWRLSYTHPMAQDLRAYRAYRAGKGPRLPRDRYRALYREYITQAKAWTARSILSRQRDGGVCRVLQLDGQHCGDPGRSVHHLTYEYLFAEPLSSLITCCRACHAFLDDKVPLPDQAPVPARGPDILPPAAIIGASPLAATLQGALTGDAHARVSIERLWRCLCGAANPGHVPRCRCGKARP
jgi:hypothetical protein